jgi:hypothetical protein
MSFAAVMPGSGGIGDFGTPAVDAKFGISAVNHKPVNGIAADGTADFTTKFP